MGNSEKSPLNRREALHLSRSILLEESGVPLIVRVVIITLSVVVAVFIAWAALTKVEEVAVSSGVIEPTGHNKVVETGQGGIVAEILVSEGQRVRQGQVLVKLDPLATMSKLSESLSRQASLEARKETLLALLENRPPSYSSVPARYRDFADHQAKRYRQTRESLAVERSILESRIAQYKAELKELDNREKTVKENYGLLKEELETYSRMYKERLVTTKDFNNVKRLYLQAQDSLLQLPIRRSQVEEMLAESVNRVARLGIEAKEGWLKELDKLKEELPQVSEVIVRAQQQSEFMAIRSPSAGLVHNLRIRNNGVVVEPGGAIMEIVPEDSGLVAVTRVSSRDIGHIQMGQPVTLKFTAYDFSRYGGIQGRLMDLSPTALSDAAGKLYYKAVISLSRNYVGNDKKYHILPGMQVQAEINTGNKTILEYLLKPVYLSVKQAFRER